MEGTSHIPRAISRPFNESLEDFLSSRSVDNLVATGTPLDELYITHVSLSGRPAGGKYCIKDADRSQFRRLYYQRLKHSGPFSVTPAIYLAEVIKNQPFRFYV